MITSSSRKVPLDNSNHSAELTCNPWSVDGRSNYSYKSARIVRLNCPCHESVLENQLNPSLARRNLPAKALMYSYITLCCTRCRRCRNPSCRRRTDCLARAVPQSGYIAPARLGNPAKHQPRPCTPPMPCLTSMWRVLSARS
jgi:hypothetical protein